MHDFAGAETRHQLIPRPEPANPPRTNRRSSSNEQGGSARRARVPRSFTDSETELLEIFEDDGEIWLCVVEYRLIYIPLDDLEIAEEEQGAIKEELRRLTLALKTKKGSMLAQTAGGKE
jgi:hypothetical protein